MCAWSESCLKVVSKMEWLSEKIDQLAMGCNKGYAKLQSSRISRGRLTMTDISDEKATAAWSEQIWTKTDGAKEWPAVLRPQRPEQLVLNRYNQSQRRKKQRIHKISSDVDIFNNPPVFLTIKDIRNQKLAEEADRSPRRHCETVGESGKNSPIWPSALLTYEKDTMSDEFNMESLRMKLVRMYQLNQEELTRKKEQIAELNNREQSHSREIDDLTSKLMKSNKELQEVKAQLQIRSEATQRLEQENSIMRDTIAKLKVEVEINSFEKEKMLQRWHTAENDRINLKKKCEELEEAVAENGPFKEQCLLLQNQIRNSVSKIMSQQDLAQKNSAKVERAAEDAMSFCKMVSNHSKQMEAKSNEFSELVKINEQKMLALSVEVKRLRQERDVLLIEKVSVTNNIENRYYEDWLKYQEIMKQRIDGFIIENQRLIEELEMVKACPKCDGKFD